MTSYRVPKTLASRCTVFSSPDVVLSPESSSPSTAPTRVEPSKVVSRPARATRGKRTSLATGFIDSSKLKIDGDDEDEQHERLRPTKKPRLHHSTTLGEDADEDDFEAASITSSAAGSLRDSPTPSPSPESEPKPMPWELKYYPRTYNAVNTFTLILGPPPPDTDDLDEATNAVAHRLHPRRYKNDIPAPESKIVKLRLPPGTIDKNASFDPDRVGFMDFPGELRNEIYFLVFKGDKPQIGYPTPHIDFQGRDGFPHSSAFLRVNKTVYNEARNVLYGENHFVFGQSNSKVGNYFDKCWKEASYSHIREFLTDIGPVNTSLIKNLSISFGDSTPSAQPGLTMNERRFEHNKDLYWVLKHLARYGKLEKLKLGFSGRRMFHFGKSEAVFLHALAAVKTDRLAFGNPRRDTEDYVVGGVNLINVSASEAIHYGKLSDATKEALYGVMVRPKPLKELDPRLEF